MKYKQFIDYEAPCAEVLDLKIENPVLSEVGGDIPPGEGEEGE